MSKNIEYKVAYAPSIPLLEQAVASFLNEGWELQGGTNGMCVSEYESDLEVAPGSYIYVQAMIRDKD